MSAAQNASLETPSALSDPITVRAYQDKGSARTVATRTTIELHLRAQRWIGELSRALEKDKPGAAGGGSQPPTDRNLAEAATLKAAGQPAGGGEESGKPGAEPARSDGLEGWGTGCCSG